MSIAQDLIAIRSAMYGKDVREAIAHGIEQCYSDVSAAKTVADDSADAANEAAELANDKANLANEAVTTIDDKIDDIVLVQADQPESSTNKIWIKPESDEYKVPTWDEFQALSAKVDELIAWKEQHS